MKIVFYTSGSAGSGRLVRGIAIGNALKRQGYHGEYTIVSSSEFAHLADLFEIDHLEISLENEQELSLERYKKSLLYATLRELKPDIIIVDLLWFSLFHFIDDLSCTKFFLCHQVFDDFFSITGKNVDLEFDSGQYDYLISIEPFDSKFGFTPVNPLILRNGEEIYSKPEAVEKLSLKKMDKNALFAINARPGDFERLKQKYAYLEQKGFNVTYTTNYEGGIFPVIDYFNAFDLVVCLAGYNQFWECRYFNKEAIFETIPLHFSSMEERIKTGKDFHFDVNGADQLADMVVHG